MNHGSLRSILRLLGHEPTVIASGGPPCPEGGHFESFFNGKWCKADWVKVTKYLVERDWGRKILRKMGYPSHDSWPATYALRENPEDRLKLIALVLEQKTIFDAQNGITHTQPLPRLTKNKPKKPEPVDPKKLERRRFLDIAMPAVREGRKLRKQKRQVYLDRVEEAEKRKQDWLRPLMWEAAYNQEYNRRNNKKTRRMKQQFYSKAKDTACFDCGIQKSKSEMSFDHLRDKTFNLGSLHGKGWDRVNWRRLHTEIGKCDVVCRDCHDIREYFRGKHSWEGLNLAQQKRVEAMCFVEREVFFRIVTREEESSNIIDGESLRRIVTLTSHIIEQIQHISVGDLRAAPVTKVSSINSQPIALSSTRIQETWRRIKARISQSR
jgi:hypothetical protein